MGIRAWEWVLAELAPCVSDTCSATRRAYPPCIPAMCLCLAEAPSSPSVEGSPSHPACHPWALKILVTALCPLASVMGTASPLPWCHLSLARLSTPISQTDDKLPFPQGEGWEDTMQPREGTLLPFCLPCLLCDIGHS